MTGSPFPETIRVVDSHTEGEPTRVVIEGWPLPSGATMAERRDDLRRRFDHLRKAIIAEPRGHEAIVGALLTAPVEEGSEAGVIFFNNVGYLGMCGHGTIGVVRTLEYLRRLKPGIARLDTPAGTVSTELHDDGTVSIESVPAFCDRQDVAVTVAGVGHITGDIAYGGNWFFITEIPGLNVTYSNRAELTRITLAIASALHKEGITGKDGAEIDHVELSAPPSRPDADSRNFVLCPGGEYDRSPCGTGTSAKMAVLHARGKLDLEKPWRQESITGSLFTGWLTKYNGRLIPHIRGGAFITGETLLRFDPRDPFAGGVRAA